MFLADLLPSDGYICVAMALPKGGFRHFFCENISDAQQQIDVLDRSGNTVFVAQASFITTESRKQPNAAYLKNFFLDIDCGPNKDYPSQQEAVVALKDFVAATDLPFPSVVSSGNGLYAHWLLDTAIPAQQWKTTARIFKDTVLAYGFKTDPSRTADSSSVLRPPGATHRKDPSNPKTVQLLKHQAPITYTTFATALAKAARKKKVDTDAVRPPTEADPNADFIAGLAGRAPSSIVAAAEKCQQLKTFRDSEGDVSEPYWYSALGVMVHCDDGKDFIHPWSAGHPQYSFSLTAAKAQQYLDSGAGPTTCVKFGMENPEACIGCPHNGKIKSPIVLGFPEPKALEAPNELMQTAEGFRRSNEGLFYEDDGRWVRFYDQDMYIDRIAYDMSLGYQVAIIRHHLPHEGWMEFMLRSSLIHDPRGLMVALSDNNVHVVGVKEKKLMTVYIEGHIARMQRMRKMTLLLSQMGWKRTTAEKDLFVLGKKLFHGDGTVENASLAQNVPTAAKGFRSEGDPNLWTAATELLNAPGMEPFAFSLLCGFAAPLMKFTGFDGALISLVGDSGVGKTLMLRFVQSIYGQHNELMMLRDDTRNALVSRLAVYGNLPLTVDEVTNIDGQELSDLVYRFTQGRDKARLTKNSEERATLNTWNTLAMVSTNSALADKLTGTKHDASAELNRVFEYNVPNVAAFSGETTAKLYWTLNNNFGHAGERYVQYLAANVDTLAEKIGAVQQRINESVQIRGDERFWAAIVATAIYGGLVAQRLGLIKFEISRVLSWAEKQIVSLRGEKSELADNSIDILAQFLDTHSANRLIVNGVAKGRRDCAVIEPPRGALVIRYEINRDRLFISRTAIKTFLTKRFGSYNRVRNDLTEMGALKQAGIRKSLGAGTIHTGASQPCWEIDLKCQKLGAVGIQLVTSASVMKKVADKVNEVP